MTTVPLGDEEIASTLQFRIASETNAMEWNRSRIVHSRNSFVGNCSPGFSSHLDAWEMKKWCEKVCSLMRKSKRKTLNFLSLLGSSAAKFAWTKLSSSSPYERLNLENSFLHPRLDFLFSWLYKEEIWALTFVKNLILASNKTMTLFSQFLDLFLVELELLSLLLDEHHHSSLPLAHSGYF